MAWALPRIREPLLIEADEHFLARTGADLLRRSILDSRPAGRSTQYFRPLRLSAAPTLALVRLAVRTSRTGAVGAASRQHLLRFHPHREFISSAGEGILRSPPMAASSARISRRWSGSGCRRTLRCVDSRSSRCLAWNCRGWRCFCTPTPRRRRHCRNATAARCASASYSHALPTRRSAGFRGASGPDSTLPRADALAQAERRVARVLDACRWNVSLAATQRIEPPHAHRKLKAHGMRRQSGGNGDSGADC